MGLPRFSKHLWQAQQRSAGVAHVLSKHLWQAQQRSAAVAHVLSKHLWQAQQRSDGVARARSINVGWFVHAPDLAQRVRDFADRGRLAQSLAQRIEQITLASCDTL